jgi:DNA-binding PucR family transcriptional regulator
VRVRVQEWAGTAVSGTTARRVEASRIEASRTTGGPEPPLHELLLASVPAPVLRSLSERLLGPLLEYDARHHAGLLSTLESFLACDGSWSACAARMYVHVNTVRYRISRIEALTGRDLSALADRVDFFLALRGA